jgi:hypothetical protein
MNTVGTAIALLAFMTWGAGAGHGRSSQQRGIDPQLAQILATEDARAPHPDDLRILIQTAKNARSDLEGDVITKIEVPREQ